MIRLVAATAFSLALAACGSREDQAPSEPPAPTPSASASPDAVARVVTLKGDGLSIGGRDLAFGAAKPEVIAALFAVHDGEAPTRSRNAECGAGPLDFAAWGDGLQLAFQAERFVGWSVDGATATHRTPEGVSVGQTLAQARTAWPTLQVTEDTIGPEFAAGDYFGTLSGLTDAARIKSLWAGVSCIFR